MYDWVTKSTVSDHTPTESIETYQNTRSTTVESNSIVAASALDVQDESVVMICLIGLTMQRVEATCGVIIIEEAVCENRGTNHSYCMC